MSATLFLGSLNIVFCICVALLVLALCIIYQTTRNRFTYITFGELIIGSISKEDILIQNKIFSIRRWPLFLLAIVTLIVNCDLFKGIADGEVYDIGSVVFYTLLFFCTYYGIKNFCIKPDMLPVFLMMGGLLYASVVLKKSLVLADIYYALLISWLSIGLIYKRYSIKEVN